MKLKIVACSLLVCAALSSAQLTRAAADESAKKSTQAELQAQAKVTEAQARALALTKAPGGKVESSELEEENGHLIWSFDISTPGTKNITEVQVDAKDGKIVAVDIETPKDQAKEANEDKKASKKSKKAKDDDDDDDEKDEKPKKKSE
jgi:hypothetical protein